MANPGSGHLSAPSALFAPISVLCSNAHDEARVVDVAGHGVPGAGTGVVGTQRRDAHEKQLE